MVSKKRWGVIAGAATIFFGLVGLVMRQKRKDKDVTVADL